MKQQSDIAKLERKLGIPVGLFFSLRDENDWSFLIKIFALLESALSYLLKTEIARKELDSFIDELPFKGRSSKISLIQTLDLLDPLHLKYLEFLGQFRNDMAHDIKFAGFDLTAHIEKFTDNQLREFIKTAACLEPTTEIQINKNTRQKLRATPRHFIWLGAMDCLMLVYFKDQVAELTRQREALLKSISTTENLGLSPLSGLAYLASTSGGLLGLPHNEKGRTR